MSNPEDNQWEKRFDDEFIHYNGEFIEATWKDAVGCVGTVKQFIRRLLSQQAEKKREEIIAEVDEDYDIAYQAGRVDGYNEAKKDLTNNSD